MSLSSGLSIPSSGARDGYTTRGYGGGRANRGVSHRRSQRNSVTAGGVYHSAGAEVATDRYIPSSPERDVKKKLVTKTKPVRCTYGRVTTTSMTRTRLQQRQPKQQQQQRSSACSGYSDRDSWCRRATRKNHRRPMYYNITNIM